MTPKIHFHEHDLPEGLDLGKSVAIDTETMGLNLHRDRLCLVQLSAGDGVCHLVKIGMEREEAPHLQSLLEDPSVKKLFHFARFDVASLWQNLGIQTTHIYCTKIASKLARTYTDRHGLKNLCKDLLNIDLSKEQQQTDWGASNHTKEQLLYAATDVLYLHQLKEVLDEKLEREGRYEIAQKCFDFLVDRVYMDLVGFNGWDVFEH